MYIHIYIYIYIYIYIFVLHKQMPTLHNYIHTMYIKIICPNIIIYTVGLYNICTHAHVAYYITA